MKTRREFLKTAITLSAAYTLPRILRSTNARAAASTNGETTLIYVFLRGGADSLSLLAPKAGTTDHGIYTAARPDAILQVQNALELGGQNGHLHALNPLAQNIHQLYSAGHLAFINGIGSTSDSQSHFVQQELVEGGRGEESSKDGFLNRTLSLLPAGSVSTTIPAASLNSSLAFSLRGPHPAVALDNLSTRLSSPAGMTSHYSLANRLQDFWTGSHQGIAGTDIERMGKLAQRATTGMIAADQISNSSLGSAEDYGGLTGFRDAVKLLRADRSTRVLTIDVKLWDFHTNHNVTQAGPYGAMLLRLDKALGTFAKDLGAFARNSPETCPRPNDLWEKVCLVVMSEFGRRVRKNQTLGFDHGRAGGAMVIGGSVTGGQIIQHSTYGLGNLTPGGDIPVSIDYRALMGEVIQKHLGVPASEVAAKIFPNSSLGDLGLFRGCK